MTTPSDQPLPATPPVVPPAAAETPKPVSKPMPPPMKGWRNYPGDPKLKFKQTRSPATRFIQARRAPGK